ncbi:MAG TPA: methylated-DNA--[protein]-cysteine S-methyltransferase [Candidatus Acidoferrales bacterium]|nr:methylated-DNA--[protein]-cysteine S-methyltransferase [Candidatus Acidoferrales bacterium]
MNTKGETTLWDEDIMYEAFMKRDASYEGIFFVAVRTTGIFCRPTCRARRAKREHIEFYQTAKDALLNGYRPCKVCRPLELLGSTPDFIQKLIDRVAADPSKKITDYDLVKMKIEPSKVRRWFKTNHGLTFQGYQRMLRINSALHQIKNGESVTEAAFENGYDSLSGFSEAFRKIVGTNPNGAKYANVINIHRFVTPLGPMIAGATEEGICLLEFTERRMLESEFGDLRRKLKANFVYGINEHISNLETQMREYFEGKRKTFDVPLVTPGSEFQKSVWQQLTTIPYGHTRSYEEQAIAINNLKALRAVASANGFNRIAIVIPCHRVIGKNGSLTGYGGGLWRKKWLLDFEKSNAKN